jgi:hypothetical protein
MQLVDLYGDVDWWTEADLHSRAMSMLVTSKYGNLDYLRQRLHSASVGMALLTEEEKSTWRAVQEANVEVQASVQQGLADLERLRAARVIEAMKVRPDDEGDDEGNALKAVQRQELQHALDTAPPDVLQLVVMRGRLLDQEV